MNGKIMKLDITKFVESIEEINEAFGVPIIYSPFYEKEQWYLDESELHWCDPGEMPDEDGEFTYSAERRYGIQELEDWTAIHISDGCGENYWAVFKNENRIHKIK